MSGFRTPVSKIDHREKARIVQKMIRVRSNLKQMWLDAEHWNNTHPDEPPLTDKDFDPDGKAKRMIEWIDRALDGEVQ